MGLLPGRGAVPLDQRYMTSNDLIPAAAPAPLTIAALALSVGIAVYFARTIRRAFAVWIGKWRRFWAYRTNSRRARRIVAALELIDTVLTEPDPKVTDAAELRAGLQRLLAVIAAEQLAELSEIEAKLFRVPRR